MKKFSTNQGFTLLEVIIYITIVGVVLSTLMTYALNIMEIGSKSSTIQEVSANARYVSERIKYLVRNADNIDFASSDFSVNLADNPGTKIILFEPSPDQNTTITVVNGILTLNQASTGFNPIALNSNLTKVTELTFTNYSAVDNETKYLGFVLRLESAYGSSRQEYQQSVSLQSGAELRSN